MGMHGSMARDSFSQELCVLIGKKIAKYPKAETALKELGREILGALPYRPDWSDRFYELFEE